MVGHATRPRVIHKSRLDWGTIPARSVAQPPAHARVGNDSRQGRPSGGRLDERPELSPVDGLKPPRERTEVLKLATHKSPSSLGSLRRFRVEEATVGLASLRT